MYARSRLILLLLVIEIMSQSYLHRQRSDLARQPHACWLQKASSKRCRVPLEVWSTTADSVDAAIAAVLVPETAAVEHRTIVLASTAAVAGQRVVVAGPQVVLTVIRAKHHAVLVAECITDVTPVSRHLKLVVTWLPVHQERTVLGVVPGEITQLQVKSQLVWADLCQLTEKIVAKPVVSNRVVESDFKLRPRTVEEVGPAYILLNQKWDTASCQSNEHQQLSWVSLIKKVIRCII